MAIDDPSISVLCVDDEPGMADLVGTYLERVSEGLSVTAATSVRRGLRLLERTEFDCVVSDYDMPQADGLTFLESVRSERPELPFILFTGRGSEEIASDAVSAGVTDYMQKEAGTDQYSVLARRVRNAVTRYRARSEAAEAQKRAETILETSPDAIVVSVAGECVYANPAAVDLLDVDDEAAFAGRALSEFLDCDDDADAARSIRAGDRVVDRRQRTLRTDSGRTVPVEATARAISWDGADGIVSILRDVSGRVERERELAHQRGLLDSLYEASPSGILVVTDRREIVTYNDRFADLWGIPEGVLDRGDGDLAMEAVLDRIEDGETFVRNVERQLDRPEESQRNEVRLTDGTVLDQYSTSIPDGDGGVGGYVWYYTDITDLKRLERERREAFDRMTDAVYALDDEWRFTFLNDRAGRLLRHDPDELLGENVWDAFPEAADSEIHTRYVEAFDTGDSVAFETYYEPLDTDFEIRVFPSESGLTVYFRDLTEERRMAAELRGNLEALQRLYTVTSDPELPFETKQERILEVATEYLDLPYGFVTRIDEGTQTVVAAHGSHEALQPGESCPLDRSYCRKTIASDDGTLAVRNAVEAGWEDDPGYREFELGTYIGGRFDVDGDLYGTVCFAASDPRAREFSESERTFVELIARWMAYEFEEREYRAQLEAKNDQLEEFAGIVSHDLRNPLNVAAGRLELARAADTDAAEHLAEIERAHDRMETLIDDILTVARTGRVVDGLVPVDLAAAVETCWTNVATGDAALAIETESRVVADDRRLAQLLENLVGNAVEHGGEDVTVTVGDLPDGFYVEDDGGGIPAGDRERLFGAGRPDGEGRGLGLRIVGRIVEAHGWTVAAVEAASGGTRIEITGVDRVG